MPFQIRLCVVVATKAKWSLGFDISRIPSLDRCCLRLYVYLLCCHWWNLIAQPRHDRSQLACPFMLIYLCFRFTFLLPLWANDTMLSICCLFIASGDGGTVKPILFQGWNLISFSVYNNRNFSSINNNITKRGSQTQNQHAYLITMRVF